MCHKHFLPNLPLNPLKGTDRKKLPSGQFQGGASLKGWLDL